MSDCDKSSRADLRRSAWWEGYLYGGWIGKFWWPAHHSPYLWPCPSSLCLNWSQRSLRALERSCQQILQETRRGSKRRHANGNWEVLGSGRRHDTLKDATPTGACHADQARAFPWTGGVWDSACGWKLHPKITFIIYSLSCHFKLYHYHPYRDSPNYDDFRFGEPWKCENGPYSGLSL